VGVSIKNIGAYLKSSLNGGGGGGKPTANGAENLKSFQSLNIKPSPQTYKVNAPPPSSSTSIVSSHGQPASSNGHLISPDLITARSSHRQANLVHRHSNPVTTATHYSVMQASNVMSGGGGGSLSIHNQSATFKNRLHQALTTAAVSVAASTQPAVASSPDSSAATAASAAALPRIKINT
jgi:hypothetical protein